MQSNQQIIDKPTCRGEMTWRQFHAIVLEKNIRDACYGKHVKEKFPNLLPASETNPIKFLSAFKKIDL